jgi:hypothetical protein
MSTDTTGAPRAWIIEPKDKARDPYLTLKADVAEKRAKAGDYVTPYISQHTADDDEEL